MTLLTNVRNGVTNQWGTASTSWSTGTHEYAVVINRDWSASAWRHTLSTGVWEEFDLGTISGNPLSLPFDANAQSDTHYQFAICVDPLGTVHITGNIHNDPHQYVVCTNQAAWGTAGSWASGLSRLPNLLLTGVNETSYGIFRPAPDGTIFWMFHQQDTTGNVNGRDVLMFSLAPGDTDWEPIAGDGEFMICPEDGNEATEPPWTGTTPGRAYTASFRFDQTGVFHFFGMWQMVTLTATTRTEMFYVRRTVEGVWETIEGDPVTLPLQYPASNAGLVPDQLPWINQNWQMALDADGYPHIIVQSVNPNRRHHWWDGSAWQYEDTSNYGHLECIRGDLWTMRTATQGHILLRGPNGEQVKMSGTVPNNFEPAPDPVRALRGVVSVLAPYGDTPKVFTFGEGARMVVAA